jgi:putative FmdB family regulatory protein
MPNYDFHCLNCKKRFELFISFKDYGKKKVHCPFCQSLDVQRRIGKVRISRSDDSRLEDFSDPDALEGLDENPQSMGRMLRKMKSQVGEDAGPEFDEVVGRLESGETPDQIESEMPQMGNESGQLPIPEMDDES